MSDHTFSDEIDIGAIALTLWRAKLKIAFAVILAIVAVFIYVDRNVDRTYRASASVALEGQESRVTGFESVVPGLSGDDQTLNTQIQVIRSRQLIGRLVDQLNLTEDPEFNPYLRATKRWSVAGILELVRGPVERPVPTTEVQRDIAIDVVLRQLQVSNLRKSYVFQITFTAGEPRKAAKIANTIATLYINDQLIVKEQAALEAIQYLAERTAVLQTELSEAELAVKNFSATTDLVSPEALVARNQRVKEMRDRLDNLSENVSEVDARIANLRALDLSTATRSDIDQLDMVQLSAAYSRFESGRTSAADMQAMLDQFIAQAEALRDSEEQQTNSLSRAIDAIEAEIDAQSADLLTLRQLEREAQVAEELYNYFLARLKETEVQQGTLQADVRTLSNAFVPRTPSGPAKLIISALAGLLTFVLMAAILILRESRNQTVRTSEQLEAVSEATVVGQIPAAPVRRRAKLLDYLTSNAASPFAEAVRNLRTSVLLAESGGTPPKVIMLTSSVPGEGKTTISLALAQNLAGLGKKVLLIDADIRRRTLEEYFDVSEFSHLTDIVEVEGQIASQVNHSDRLGVSVILGGKTNLNAADFFSSDKFKNFMSKARDEFDFVVIDTPPVLVVPDARIIGKLVDVIVYACKWDSTQKAQLKAGVASLRTIDLPVSMTVLSQIDGRQMKRYGYGNNYGAYSTYGSSYYNT